MLALKLAYRNLIGAGLRTWLNVIVLSFAFVIVIWNQGFLEGWDRQASRDTIEWEIGGGQYWHSAYDPYDPFSLDSGHDIVPAAFETGIRQGFLIPVLIVQASIYPQGRMQSVLLKGIDPEQKSIRIPAAALSTDGSEIPAIIGERMAHSIKLGLGDLVTVRWRDANGMFDAAELKIVKIMKSNVVSIDKGQIWLPIEKLRGMMRLPGHATMVISDRNAAVLPVPIGWEFKDQEFLLQDIKKIIEAKSIGRDILFTILLFLAVLAIFDTQVLSIFRRQREIGTLIALGMTRTQVIRLFTVEGAMHGILAGIVAAIYGIPLLTYSAVKGFAMPREMMDSFGMTMAERIFPTYTAGLILSTTLIVLVTVTIVSFIPTRKIAKMNPTDAIRGKII